MSTKTMAPMSHCYVLQLTTSVGCCAIPCRMGAGLKLQSPRYRSPMISALKGCVALFSETINIPTPAASLQSGSHSLSWSNAIPATAIRPLSLEQSHVIKKSYSANRLREPSRCRHRGGYYGKNLRQSSTSCVIHRVRVHGSPAA